MEKFLLIAGCSHTAGSEIDGQEDSSYNRQNSFGGLLAKKLNCKPVNIAQNGMTNSGIARSILMWFHNNYNPETMKVQVLVSWTESLRLEVPSLKRYFCYNLSSIAADWFDKTANMFYRINLGWAGGDDEERELFPYYHQFIVRNEEFIEMQSINYILQIQYFLKSKNINYLMCNAMHTFTLPNNIHDEYLQLVDNKHYYNMTNNDESFFWKFKNQGYINPKAKYWHHGEEPHRLYSEELYNFIGENNVLVKMD